MAVTTINLTTASIEVDKFNGTLSAKESGALSAYNSDMKKLIRKVKKLPDYTDDTYYIMLVAKSDNPALGGFMPVNSNFGFVFAQANSGAGQMNRTIAHELGHGAFRLWHTFSSENLYTAQQGTTRNLMDYNGTNAQLYKYQWDYIHNPQEGVVRWMVEDDEGKMEDYMKYDENAKVGGMMAFIEYIISNQTVFQQFKEEILDQNIEDIANINVANADIILKNLLGDKKIQIDDDEEALFIIKNAYLYWILNEQQRFVDYLEEQEDYKEDNSDVKEFIKDVVKTFLTNDGMYEYYSQIKERLIRAKELEIQNKTISEVEELVKNTTNQKFKGLLRNELKITDNTEIQRILNLKRSNNLEEFLNQHKAYLYNNRTKISQYISGNDLFAQNVKVTSTKSFKMLKIIGENVGMVDVATFFSDVNLNKTTPAEVVLSCGVTPMVLADITSWMFSFTGAVAITGLSKVFTYEVNRIVEANQFTIGEALKWNTVAHWKTNNYFKELNDKNIYLQYTEEQEKYNYTIPTSIRIYDKNLAKSIFGFEPKFVNYDFLQGNDVKSFHPRYYVPYETNR